MVVNSNRSTSLILITMVKTILRRLTVVLSLGLFAFLLDFGASSVVHSTKEESAHCEIDQILYPKTKQFRIFQNPKLLTND